MKVSKIVLTGGPCAGKSTAIKFLKEELKKRNKIVYTIPEPATYLMSNGVQIIHFPSVMQYRV